MSLLDKIGLARKRKELTPLLGEKKKKEREAYSLKKNPYIKALIFFCFIGLSLLMLPQSAVNSTFNYSIGQPWRSDDLTAPFTFAVNKTTEEIDQEKESIRKSLAAVYSVDNNAGISIQSKIDSLYRKIQPVLEEYSAWQESKETHSQNQFTDSLRFAQSFSQTTLNFTDKSWQLLLESHYRVKKQKLSPSRFAGVAVKNELETLIDQLMAEGIINRSKSFLEQDEITVRNSANSTEKTVSISRVRDRKEANEYAQFYLNRRLNDQEAQLALELYNKVILPNYLYNEGDTEERIAEALSTISETKGAIAQGQVIIRKGDIVTQERANVLTSLAQTRSKNATLSERWLRFGGNAVAVVAIALVFFMYIYLYRGNIGGNNGLFLLVFLTLGAIILFSFFVLRYDIAHPFIIPVAIAPLILTIIFDSRVGIIATVTLASLIGLAGGNDFEFTIATICACSMGVFSVRDIKDRSRFFFITPGIVFITYVIVLGGFALAKYSSWESYFGIIVFVALNAVFILFTYPLILLFEKLFGVTTDFTLLELSDTNRPILKDLMNKAPGTFHHSLQVANLSEAAASTVRANPLLCRVGAMYHDIGKIIKPSYFVENQISGINEHDKLKPQMSAMVIKAHVSEGIRIAEEHHLPETIIDFIRTHHGTMFIRYFYEKAKEDPELMNMLSEDQFRYDGPLPSTKETGILLLADGIEAASRAMKNPTYSKLEALVNKMVDDRVAEGQLSQCPLTFKDLQNIKEAFLNILIGVYHSRIEYPEPKEETPKTKHGTPADKQDKHSSDNVENTAQ